MNLTLEMLVIRFSTLKDFGMIMNTIEPTIDMIKNIQLDISAIIPTANGEGRRRMGGPDIGSTRWWTAD